MRSLVLLLRALVTCTVSLICRQVAENLGADGEHPPHSDERGSLKVTTSGDTQVQVQKRRPVIHTCKHAPPCVRQLM